MPTIGFIGAGNMAEALIKGITSAGVYEPADVLISDIRENRLEFLAGRYAVTCAGDNAELAAKADTIVLSVKPQVMSDALGEIEDAVTADKLVISIAAGITIARITDVLGDLPVVRVMPNTPALIAQGASGVCANERAGSMLEMVKSIFESVGKVVFVDDEDLIDSVTAVSGSGPAYYFLLMEKMIEAGVGLGLAPDVAKDLVLQTAKGAAILALEADGTGETPAELRRKVTSPGGTTEAALKVFADGKMPETIVAGVTRARDRARELSG
jgi:pyrroline-5-carboxylate reductase